VSGRDKVSEWVSERVSEWVGGWVSDDRTAIRLTGQRQRSSIAVSHCSSLTHSLTHSLSVRPSARSDLNTLTHSLTHHRHSQFTHSLTHSQLPVHSSLEKLVESVS